MSTASTTARPSTVTAGGHQFPVTRDEYADPTDPAGDFVTWHLQLESPGAVEVARSGWDGLGPCAVDLYRPSAGELLTVEEARRWAHAILAAADLAEQLEHAAAEQPC